jgi:hypothetical protein
MLSDIQLVTAAAEIWLLLHCMLLQHWQHVTNPEKWYGLVGEVIWAGWQSGMGWWEKWYGLVGEQHWFLSHSRSY